MEYYSSTIQSRTLWQFTEQQTTYWKLECSGSIFWVFVMGGGGVCAGGGDLGMLSRKKGQCLPACVEMALAPLRQQSGVSAEDLHQTKSDLSS
jgi:hypothetical protein